MTRSRVLITSPTEGQSKELLSYVREMHDAMGGPIKLVAESETRLKWANGSEVKAKADRAKSIRGFTPDLIVIDEAAQVSDELYYSIEPMMTLGKADILAPSTPFGKLGWFFDLWNDKEKYRRWEHVKVTALQCPRIDREELDHQRAILPPRWFNQEFMCEFNDAVDSVFGRDVIESAVRSEDAYLPIDLGA